MMGKMTDLALVPAPRKLTRAGVGTALSRGMVVAADEGLGAVASLLAREIEAGTGWRVRLGGASETSEHGTVRLLLRGDGPEEGYSLSCTDGVVEIVASSPAGTYYATRTLRQMMPPDWLRAAPAKETTGTVLPGVEIDDHPRFAWRGVHLDVARHFLPKRFVLRLIEVASLHKMNVLHLHLTDDQGWRVPIDRYPKLTAVGAWRRGSPAGHYSEHRFDGVPHGGFFSIMDLREIVAHASRHHMTVVPEIDMPGHMQAAIAAYPELGNSAEPLEVMTDWGVSEHVLNLEEPAVRFCREVLEEVMDIFPGRYVHIGGDECPISEWQASERARAHCQSVGLAGVEGLQGWFTARMAEVLAARGRVVVGWEEMEDRGAPAGAVVMPWRQGSAEAAAIRATRGGHDVVMVPEDRTYFDWAQSDGSGEPVAIRGSTSVEKVYSFEPVPPGAEIAHVIGTQCQLWTEYVATPEQAEYMYFPRLCALSEVAWTPGEREWPGFERRLRGHMARLDALGVNYRPLDGPTPGQSRTWERPPGTA
jgi:hexosaminidase